MNGVLSVLQKKFNESMLKIPKIERTMIDNERFYTVAGVKGYFPSVTTVLSIVKKHKLERWETTLITNKIRTEVLKMSEHPTWRTQKTVVVDNIIQVALESPNYRRDLAVDFGNKAHSIIDELIKGVPPPVVLDEKYRALVLGFEKWKRDSKLNLIAPETLIFSQKFKYAGAMDAIGIATGKDGKEHLVAIDWKTTNELRPEHALQVAAYAKGLQEMINLPVEEAWVIRFDKHGRLTYDEYKLASVDKVFARFEAALMLWQTYRNAKEEDFWQISKQQLTNT